MPTVLYLYFHTFHSLIEQQCQGLQSQPVVVAKQHRIIDVSTEAAQIGVRKGESVGRAKLTCPQLVVVNARRDYATYSEAVWDICTSYTPVIEPVAEDAAFLDLTGCGEPVKIAQELIEQIQYKTHLPAAASIGPSKLIAKTAALLPAQSKQLAGYKKAKNLIFVPADSAASFLRPIPVKYLWGLPPTVVEKLTSLGCQTLGDLAKVPLLQLQIKFGREAKRLANLAVGIDQDPVQPNYPERCFIDGYTCPPEVGYLEQALEIHTILSKSAEKLFQKLLDSDKACTKITLQIEFADGSSSKLSKKLPEPIEQLPRLTREIVRLWQQLPPKPLTAITVHIGGLTPRAKEQVSLYHQKQQQTQNLKKALMYLSEKLGPSTVKPASAIEIPRREKMLNLIEQNIL